MGTILGATTARAKLPPLTSASRLPPGRVSPRVSEFLLSAFCITPEPSLTLACSGVPVGGFSAFFVYRLRVGSQTLCSSPRAPPSTDSVPVPQSLPSPLLPGVPPPPAAAASVWPDIHPFMLSPLWPIAPPSSWSPSLLGLSPHGFKCPSGRLIPPLLYRSALWSSPANCTLPAFSRLPSHADPHRPLISSSPASQHACCARNDSRRNDRSGETPPFDLRLNTAPGSCVPPVCPFCFLWSLFSVFLRYCPRTQTL
jgi:hypothetical protein